MTPAIAKNVPLAPLTSWLVGGTADYLSEPRSLDELKAVLDWARSSSLPVSVLSGGTNVLISDSGIRGLVLALKRFTGVTIEESLDEGRLKLTCLSGTSKSELLKTFLRYRLEPALFLAGLPGDLGGGVVMNAGVSESIRPREFVEITDWIEVLRWDEARNEYVIARFHSSELEWSYRHCEGWRPGVIVRVGLSWPLNAQADVLERVRKANQLRLSKQPLDMPSCGSVFRNPPGDSAGRLIESCGLKGFSIGGAQVSPKHANFIVNTGGATALEIHQVIEKVKQQVLDLRGVSLQTEVVYLGEW